MFVSAQTNIAKSKMIRNFHLVYFHKRRITMKTLSFKNIVCITAISIMSSIAFAGGTNTEGKPAAGQSNDPDPGLKSGDMGSVGVGQDTKQDTSMVDDATLTTNVQKALKDDPSLSKLMIDVKVSGGVVTLTGVASDKRWSARATQVANSVPGVKSVTNSMTTK